MKGLTHGLLLVGLLVVLSATARPTVAQSGAVESAGDWLALGVSGAAGLATVLLHDERGRADFVASALVNLSLTYLGKAAASRTRPSGGSDTSMPSGHTSVAFNGAAFLHRRYGLKYGAPAYALSTFVGFSRVHADRHFVTDVLAGAALGAATAFLLTDRFNAVEVRTNRIGDRNGVLFRVRF